MACEQEMCANWAGDSGCPCAVLDIEPEDRPIVHENGTIGGDAW